MAYSGSFLFYWFLLRFLLREAKLGKNENGRNLLRFFMTASRQMAQNVRVHPRKRTVRCRRFRRRRASSARHHPQVPDLRFTSPGLEKTSPGLEKTSPGLVKEASKPRAERMPRGAAGSGIRRHKPSVGQVRAVAKPPRKQRIDTRKVHKVKKLRFCDKKNKPSFDFSNFSFHICPRSFRRMAGGQGDLRHLQNSHLSDTSRLPKRLILTDKQITKPPARS